MYVILPGEMSYTESYNFLKTAGEVIANARIILKLNRGSRPNDRLTTAQEKAYDNYIGSAKGLLGYYDCRGDESVTDDYIETFTDFLCVLAEDEDFCDMVEEYFKQVKATFNNLLTSSSDKSIRFRGVEILLGGYNAAILVSRALGADHFLVIDPMSDLYVDESE